MSPMCSVNILVGCILGVFTLLYQAATETQSVCYGKTILPAVAFGIVFGMIFLKALRIFLIFEYPRIARSRMLRDDFLIGISLILAFVDGILAFVYVNRGNIEPSIKDFTDVNTHVWTCRPRTGSEATATALMGVLLGFNGLIMLLCVLIGQMTRQAAAKFSESKSVGAMVYVSLAAVLLGESALASKQQPSIFSAYTESLDRLLHGLSPSYLLSS
ncbi:7 transmembrane sweet-taste receptor of 3 GCPR-domain-containing protein [Obelidium mucronatum]|nr:7 transmembrane sweet-taste receptor of 3 GCPR-domain-containing protein [Obelidium mucronatum]